MDNRMRWIRTLALPAAFVMSLSAADCFGPKEEGEDGVNYVGAFKANGNFANTVGGITCSWVLSDSGSVRIILPKDAGASLTGDMFVEGKRSHVSVTVSGGNNPLPCANLGSVPISWGVHNVSGTAASFTASGDVGPIGGSTNHMTFSGALSGNAISGTLTLTQSGSNYTGSSTHSVILARQ
jgi:hypothetical protein